MSDTNPPPPPDYSASQMPPPQGAPRPGELLDRFLARLIDGVLLAVVNGILVSVIIVGAFFGSTGGFGTSSNYGANVVSAILGALIYVGYFALMESSQGQTLGKMIMKLRTVGPDGGNPTLEQAIRRNIWAGFGILAVIPIVGGFIGGVAELIAIILIAVQINSDTVNRQAWHDHFAGETKVLKIG